MTVYVVTGPPAAGKSTWIREHAKPGDITIDYDTLAQALSPGLPADPVKQPKHAVDVIMAARGAAMDEAMDITDHDVYLVHAVLTRQAEARYRSHGFEIVTIDPGYSECVRRAQEQRTPRQVEQVHRWYQQRGLA